MNGTHSPSENGRVYDLDPQLVKPFAEQPRKRFRGIKKLSESIRLVGQVTPIEVTACDDPEYIAELIDGERRLRACQMGNMAVRAVFSDTRAEDRYVRSVAANFCRQDHDAVEVMEAVVRLRESGRSVTEISGIFGKSETWVHQFTSLRRLHEDVLEELKIVGDEHKQLGKRRRSRGRMTLSIALLLVPLPQSEQARLMRSIRDSRMSIAQARTFVKRIASGKGLRVGKRQSNTSKFKSIDSAVETCLAVTERYIDMPGSEIGSLISSMSRSSRHGLAKKIDTLCSSLLMFHDAIIKG